MIHSPKRKYNKRVCVHTEEHKHACKSLEPDDFTSSWMFFSALRNSCNTWIYETSFKSQLDRLLILKSSLCFLSSWTVDSSETQGCSWWKLLALTHSRKAFQQANMLRFLPRWQRSLLSDSRQDLQGRDSGWHVCRECFLLLCWTWVASASAITDFQAL